MSKRDIHRLFCYNTISIFRRLTCCFKHMTLPLVKPQPPRSVLVLPFDADAKFRISEGWIYSAEEQAVHGHIRHYGIDFAAGRGTAIYAAADGWAVGSTQTYYQGLYKGKRLGYGLGRFVQIWHPELCLFTLYGHLNEISADVPYFTPELCEQVWVPRILSVPVEELRREAVHVRRGQMIGCVGDSGLSWGYEEGSGRGPQPSGHPSWDETHLHFEMFTRDITAHTKHIRYDPYGIYGSAGAYEHLDPQIFDFKVTAWSTDPDGEPQRIH
jgi:murein DD-endopeptidase MepM/ murein hydrolase activator NlpD